ncbi:HepT-like ribonuclease domain-containing protein [Anaerovoracaceae bacterium 41-7]|jgi:uncharacterized protein with HEPN domain|uniref:HepT-like ribonuclease domain-containing protein n=1 Tax=Emergencia sp. JLR.KK010 TaxID=3114296 RepID=UPI00203D16C9|nr:DUF86 domain-containing protein [Emergencia sp.]
MKRDPIDDVITIRKMLSYCKDIEALMDKYERNFELYQTDISYQYSCNMCIIQIGELVSRLSEDFLEHHAEIPWYAIKAMRNLHAHDYDNINFEIVWETLIKDIPELGDALQKIII